MRSQDWKKLSKEDQLYFYRCPTCGEMVDKRAIAQIVEHHSHVLHPDRLRATSQQADGNTSSFEVTAKDRAST